MGLHIEKWELEAGFLLREYGGEVMDTLIPIELYPRDINSIESETPKSNFEHTR